VLSQRKVRTWQKAYEIIMIRYIDLCVELKVIWQKLVAAARLLTKNLILFSPFSVKDHNRGKDGLHQYRNLSQTQAPGSLEVEAHIFVYGEFVR
jgi:translation initiation factor 3 subunit A